MPTYTDGAIDITTPDDSALLGQGDDRIRELKRQILDRLNSVFTDANADPMVLQNAIIATAMLADASITTAKLANLSVTTAKIADSAVGTTELADLSVAEAKIAAGAVTTGKIGALAVTDANVAGGINGSKLTNSTVDTAQLADGSVTTAKLATGAVGAAEIAASAVGTAEIADASVTTVKLADASVTAAKLSGLDFLEQRSADYTLSAAAVATRSTATQTKIAFPGIVAGDMLVVSLPTALGDESDASQIKLLNFWAVAYTNQVQLNIANPNDGPLTYPAGVYRIYCIKPASSW